MNEIIDIKEIALETIEGMILATEPKNKMLMACYRFVHVSRNRCGNPHDDWKGELLSTHKRLKEEGII